MDAKFVDVHAHISDKAFDSNRRDLVEKLSDFIVLNSGENPEDNIKILADSKKYPNLLPCIGLHPNYVSASGDNEVSAGLEFLSENMGEAFAMSEIGLDYRGKDEHQISVQKAVFGRALEMCEASRKACIVHSRKAIVDMLDMLQSYKCKAVIHNFEGNQSHYSRTLEKGIFISISTGFIKYKRDNLIKKLDLSNVFVETDSPVLSPTEEINTPLNLPKILNYISMIHNMEESELKSVIYGNFKRAFYG